MTSPPPGNLPRGISTAPAVIENVTGKIPVTRSAASVVAIIFCAFIAFAGFVALGTWQLYRLSWKLDLIAQVDQRIHATPLAAPEPSVWPAITSKKDSYRHVSATGTYLPDRSVRVQAVTELGPGFWLMTPLRLTSGAIVLVNRGFVLPHQNGTEHQTTLCGDSPADNSRAVTVTGLLRMSEPGGGFLRKNDPAAERWYSRDVEAIAQQQKLGPVAPYFIDAEANPNQPRQAASTDCPVGGLTVVSFDNNHLVYAVTWYALALMVAGAFGWTIVSQRRARAAAPRD
jgi:surfeit locus 1 family protein